MILSSIPQSNYSQDNTMSKKITINPELFKIPDMQIKRKKNNITPKAQLKVKQNKDCNKTKRNKLLKYIRQKQEETEKNKMLNLENENNEFTPKNYTNENENEFEQSLTFFKDISLPTTNVLSEPPIVLTSHATPELKNADVLPINNNENPISITNENVNMVFPTSSIYKPLPTPEYGILKNGTKPTYREFNKLVYPKKSLEPVSQMPNFSEIRIDNPTSNDMYSSTNNKYSKDTYGDLEPINLKHKYIQKNDETLEKKPYSLINKMKFPKRKKTIRRTFEIGVSKKNPNNLGILVSNKTIRDEITTKKQSLKQTPIRLVKQFLYEKGLIKVGSIAPDDVLRNMYETTSLLCGELNNHDVEIMLHNFINI